MFFNKEQPQKSAPAGAIPSVGAVPALVDTSVIIDGRIVDIAKAGFAPGQLLIPRFVLAELQLIADSGDAMKRGRGRRGLELLNDMRQSGTDMEIVEYDYDDIKEVDAKLVRLARHLSCNVLTTDYNLNRVASIEGVRVLNINELANAVRPVLLPGEHMHTKIVQLGKEKHQGVGYLADGTMIVVDGADRLIGQDVEVEITRVFQTVAGKMLFAALAGAPASTGTQLTTKTPNDSNRPKLPTHNPNPVPTNNPHLEQQSPRPPRPPRQRKPQSFGKTQSSDQASQSANKPNSVANANPKRNRRVSPTQRLENSLLELTGVDTTPPKKD